VELPLHLGAIRFEPLAATGPLVECCGDRGAHGVREIYHHATGRELSLKRGK